MKKIFVFLCLLGLLAACNSVNEPTIDPSVPQATLNAIKTAYPQSTDLKFTVLDNAKIWESEFLVKVQKMSAIVDNQGQISETYQVDRVGAKIPDNAQKYIDTNYPGATIKKISEQVDKNQVVTGYRVAIMTKENKEVVLMFDLTGALTVAAGSVKAPTGETPKSYGIDQKDLPEAIKVILKEKHGEYKYVKGLVLVENNVKSYHVVVSTATTLFEYVFDEKGTILKSSSSGIVPLTEKTLESKDIPTKIKEFLDREYKTWEFQKGVVKTQGDKILGYMIVIKFDNKLVYLNFDAAGAYLRADAAGSAPADGQKVVNIDPTTLPTAILNVIKTKFTDGYKVLTAQLATIETKKTYIVTVIKETMTYYIEFDETGKILASKSYATPAAAGTTQEKALEAAPTKIKDYLDKNYTGWTFTKGIQVVVDGKTTKYVIVIKMPDATVYYLYFTGEQVFTEAKKG
jgi:Putative beta-lactamase-inhibitor-like, PepSY-like